MPPSSEPPALVPVIEGALVQASEAFSTLLERKCQPTDSAIVLRSLEELPTLLGTVDKPVASVFFEVSCDLHGFLLIVLPLDSVSRLVLHLVGEECTPEMNESVLGEVGNVVGSAFLNHLADRFELCATPTPPQVVRDMAGALLSTVGAYLAVDGHEEFPVIQTELSGQNGEFVAYLLWLPYQSELQVLGERA